MAKNACFASQSIVVGLSRKVLSFPLCAPSLLLLIAPLYGLININWQYLGLMSCKKSHFEICHLKYFTSFYFGHLNFWSGIDYCTVKYNPSPKGLLIHILIIQKFLIGGHFHKICYITAPSRLHLTQWKFAKVVRSLDKRLIWFLLISQF